jgi:putative flippase GtrA
MRQLLGSLFKGETDNTLIQLFRYTVVGGLAFVIDFGALFSLTEFCHVHYLVSAALAFTLGLATNYGLSVLWVFNKRAVRNALVEFVIFALLGVMGLGINELTMYSLTELAGFHYLASKLFATGLTYVWNFVSRKLILFSFPPGEAEDSLPAVGVARIAVTTPPAE